MSSDRTTPPKPLSALGSTGRANLPGQFARDYQLPLANQPEGTTNPLDAALAHDDKTIVIDARGGPRLGIGPKWPSGV